MTGTISARLIAGFSLLLFFLLGIAGVGLFSVNSLRDNTRHILATEVVIGDAAQGIRYALTRARQKEKSLFISIGSTTDDNPPANKAELDEILTRLDEAVGGFRQLPLDRELAGKADQMPAQVKIYREALESIYQQIQAGTIATAFQADEALKPFKKPIYELNATVNEIAKQSAARTQTRAEELEAESSLIVKQLWVLSALAILIAAISAWLIARSIIRPIQSMSEDITRIDRDNDLSHRIRYQGKDEIGAMAVACNRLIGTLAGTMQALQQQALELKTSAQQLSLASEQVRRGSEQQADESTSMAAALEQISTSITHISCLSDDARNRSIESGHAAEEGSRQINTMVADIRNIADAIQLAAQSAEELDASSDRISGITAVIKDVADQTNLLALNAAIEAARAGEQGRGFAVVADEVRKLAEKTGQSAQEIASMISSIQQNAKNMAAQMRRSVDSVEAGMQVTQHAGDAINTITGSAGAVVHMIEELNNSLREQSAASQMLANRVEHIVQMVDDNSRSTGTVARTAHDLDQLADRLRNDVARYRVNA
ncbi:methyl-accepting chemotaxis protein [Chitinilyticum litopenaei]|uniref:methyl-accepting chemotaxis protein n=1 Tax=Chitinilyticum litopenaei TaxID=1121276 RepID=UPI0003F4E73D|nr:methyl-accepting chemotaxis protein [Chitinilyticum litopenaei]